MTALLPHMGESIHVDPLHLSVTMTYSTGSTANMHMLENPDLGVGKGVAAKLVRSCEGGAVVFGMDFDGDHDEIHWVTGPDCDAREVLLRARELVMTALAALEKLQ